MTTSRRPVLFCNLNSQPVCHFANRDLHLSILGISTHSDSTEKCLQYLHLDSFQTLQHTLIRAFSKNMTPTVHTHYRIYRIIWLESIFYWCKYTIQQVPLSFILPPLIETVCLQLNSLTDRFRPKLFGYLPVSEITRGKEQNHSKILHFCPWKLK